MSKQLLTDLLNEMESKCISDTFEVEGHKYEMRLLDGAETDWRNKYVTLSGISIEKASINLSIINAVKKPTLAVGIRSIDGGLIESLFEHEWDELKDEVKISLLADGEDAKKWFIAERFLKFIQAWADDTIEDLWKEWDKITTRRKEVKEELKKSSGESEKEENSATPPPTGKE